MDRVNDVLDAKHSASDATVRALRLVVGSLSANCNEDVEDGRCGSAQDPPEDQLLVVRKSVSTRRWVRENIASIWMFGEREDLKEDDIQKRKRIESALAPMEGGRGQDNGSVARACPATAPSERSGSTI